MAKKLSGKNIALFNASIIWGSRSLASFLGKAGAILFYPDEVRQVLTYLDQYDLVLCSFSDMANLVAAGIDPVVLSTVEFGEWEMGGTRQIIVEWISEENFVKAIADEIARRRKEK